MLKKVHVWAGISKRGRTTIIIFEGILDSNGFILLLKKGLIPFINDYYPDWYRLYMDNDSKHNSFITKNFLERNFINRLNAPPNSPVCYKFKKKLLN